MNTRRERVVITYQVAVGVAGLATAVLYLPRLFAHNLGVTVILLALGVALESIPVPLGRVLSSFLVAVPLGALAVFGVSEAVWVMVVGSLLGELFSKQQTRWQTIIFNAGQYVLCVLVMAWAYHLLVPVGRTGDPHLTWRVFAGLFAAAAVYVMVNHLFVQTLQAARSALNFREMLRALAVDSVNLLISLPFAALMVGLGASNQYLALTAVLPLVLIAVLFRLHQRTSFLQRIHSATARLTSEFDMDRLVGAAAQAAAELTYADAVTIDATNEQGDVLHQIAVYPSECASRLAQEDWPRNRGGVVWQVIDSGQDWSYVPDTRKDRRVAARGPQGGNEYLSMAVFPMRSRGKVQGAMVCYANDAYALGELTQELRSLASQVGVLMENARLYQELQQQSWHDAATGLYNYRYFYEELSRRLLAARRDELPLSVVVTDVDYFKQFNDTYGHLAGDEVLRSLAAVLTREVGPDAVVARYGGEEFGLILPQTPSDAFATVERLRLAVSRHAVAFEGHDIYNITVSSGIAGFPADGDDDRDLLLKADSAMYWGAKQRGRNRTALYTPEIDAQLFVDTVTGLYTYHFVTIRVREALLAGQRSWGALCIDLLQFSKVNTAFGFETGNQVLREAGQLIKESVRNLELVCRYNGDEFLIVLHDVSREELESIAGRIDRTLSTHAFHCLPGVALALHVQSRICSFSEVTQVESMFAQISQVFSKLNSPSDESLGAS